MDKPYKGVICGVRKDIDIANIKQEPYGVNLGYVITGRWSGHPQFGNSLGCTSLIVKKGRWTKNDEGDSYCKIETLNSRYLWTKPDA